MCSNKEHSSDMFWTFIVRSVWGSLSNFTWNPRSIEQYKSKSDTASYLQSGRITKGAIWKLKDSIGIYADLITVKSGKEADKKETTKNIKLNLEKWAGNPKFEKFRKVPMDLAIVIKMNKYRFRHQDVDNIVKIVLDALKKNNKSDTIFLFEDDSQVVRLLVWKMKREEDFYYNTDQLIISFREHDSRKQMEMIKEDEK